MLEVYIYKNTTCWPATAYDVTTGVTALYGTPGEYVILFFVFTDWFVWSVHSGKSTVFSLLSWRALARHLRTVWIRVLVIWHPMTQTQSLRLLFGQGARGCPWGEICVHCEFFSMRKKLHSRLSLFLRKEGQPSASHDAGPTAAEARRRMKLAVGSGRWVREGPPPFRARRPRTRVSCWIVTMWSFWHHQIQRLVLCWVMPSKSRRCLRARKLRLNPLNPPALHMTSYWRLWTIK